MTTAPIHSLTHSFRKCFLRKNLCAKQCTSHCGYENRRCQEKRVRGRPVVVGEAPHGVRCRLGLRRGLWQAVVGYRAGEGRGAAEAGGGATGQALSSSQGSRPCL